MTGFRRKLWLGFGLWLPIVCFAIDSRMVHVYGGWYSCVYWFVAIELGLFARYAWSARASEFERGALLAAFSLGALFALVTAVLLAPMALAGTFVLIGLLGLVPWGTFIAFSVAAVQLLRDHKPRNWLLQTAGAVTAASVLLIPPTLWRRHELGIAHAALNELQTHNHHGRACELLVLLPRCDRRELPLDYARKEELRRNLPKWIRQHWRDALRSVGSMTD
ncbi:MAG: hypothetical protein JNN27_08240 [Planctomycetes bacterium]|nr:hypothetical protein [Planctomycetota bacterium]